MVKFNAGRFIFCFQDENRKMSAIIDTKYAAEYTIDHYAFRQVLKVAVGYISLDKAKELYALLDDEPILKRIVSKAIYNRERELYS